MQSGDVQCFIRVYVAKPGKEGLVEKQGLEPTALFVERCVQPLRSEVTAKRFRSQVAEDVLRVCGQPYAAKLSRVVENQRPVA